MINWFATFILHLLIFQTVTRNAANISGASDVFCDTPREKNSKINWGGGRFVQTLANNQVIILNRVCTDPDLKRAQRSGVSDNGQPGSHSDYYSLLDCHSVAADYKNQVIGTVSEMDQYMCK